VRKRILTVSLTLLAVTALGLPVLANLTFTLNATGPVTIAGITCPAGTAVDDQCYSVTGSLSQGKTTVALSGTLETSATPSTSKSNGNCYLIFNSSTETATSATDVVNINMTGQACIKTNSKGVIAETLKSGKWIGVHSLESGTGTENWTVTPTDDLSNTAPLAGTGKISIHGDLSF
jgi:hypothetical protein